MQKKNYYKEIDSALKPYELNKPYKIYSLDWIADRIDWAWKWRKITKEQMEELADRVVKIYEGE